jgi:hypothetical protein
MNLNKKNFNKEKLFYIFLYITLIIGFFLKENVNGGAEQDWEVIFRAVKAFSIDLKDTFRNYNKFEISHYPFYYIFLSQIYKLSENIFFTKIIVLHLNLFLPIIFLKIINFKNNFRNKYLFYLPGIFFLSPSYRASSIWALNDNIALIFFCLSILFYLKTIKEKKIKKLLIFMSLNIIMLAIAAYIRQYYAIFSIFFFYKFLKKYDFKIIIYYIITNLIFAAYAIKSTVFSLNLNYSSNFLTKNFFNNIAFSITIFIIYLVPIILNKDFIIKTFTYYRKNKIIFLLNILTIITIYIFFDYSLNYGGGIVYKITYNFSSYLYFLILTISTLLLFYFLSSHYKNNIVLILCLFMAFPTTAVYQKYFDPLSIVIIFSLLDSPYIKKFIDNLKFKIKYLYIYFAIIYSGAIIYNVLLK